MPHPSLTQTTFLTWPAAPKEGCETAPVWPHLMDILDIAGYFPSNWEPGLRALDAQTLMQMFSVKAPDASNEELVDFWAVVKHAVRARLQEIEPLARIAFGMHPNDDGQAVALVAQLLVERVAPHSLDLPPLDASPY